MDVSGYETIIHSGRAKSFLVPVPEAIHAAVTSKNWYCYGGQIIRIHEI